jgi:hypothetical protein
MSAIVMVHLAKKKKEYPSPERLATIDYLFLTLSH